MCQGRSEALVLESISSKLLSYLFECSNSLGYELSLFLRPRLAALSVSKKNGCTFKHRNSFIDDDGLMFLRWMKAIEERLDRVIIDFGPQDTRETEHLPAHSIMNLEARKWAIEERGELHQPEVEHC